MPQLQLIDSATLQIVDTPAFNFTDDATYDYSAHPAPTSYTAATQDHMMPLRLTGNNTTPGPCPAHPADKPRRPHCPRDALKI